MYVSHVKNMGEKEPRVYGEGVGMDVWMNFIWNEYETWHERTREDKEVSIEKDAEEG